MTEPPVGAPGGRPADPTGKPLPGWSPDQPPAWTGPGAFAAAEGWASPGGPGAAGGTPTGPGAAGGPPPGPGYAVPAAWAPPPAAPKPGVVPLRPLGLGEILDGAVAYIRQNPRTTLGLAAVIALIGAAVQFLALLALFGSITGAAQGATSGAADLTDEEALALVSGALGATMVSLLVTFVLQTLAVGMLTHVMGKAVLGARIDAREAWRLTRPQLWRLLGLTVVVSLAVAAVFLAPVVPGVALLFSDQTLPLGVVLILVGLAAGTVLAVWLYVSWGLAPPALVLEGTGVVAALRRSRRLVTRSWWRVFGIMLLAYVIAQVVGGVLSVPFSLLSAVVGGATGLDTTTGTVLSLFLSGLAGIVASTLTVPFTAGVSALLYVDMRMRREALDLALQRATGTAGAVGQPPAGPPSGHPPTQAW